MKRLAFASLALGALALAIVTPQAQMRVTPLDMAQGHTALGLVLRHLANVGIVMEASALLALAASAWRTCFASKPMATSPHARNR